MKPWQAVVAGCGCVVVAGVLVLVALGTGIWHLAQRPEEMSLSVDAPPEVVVGQEFPLVLTVRNDREEEPIPLGDVDLSDEYTTGFQVLSIEPEPASREYDGWLGVITVRFERELQPDEELEATFHLEAVEPGVHRGNIDVYEGLRCRSIMVETRVVPDGG